MLYLSCESGIVEVNIDGDNIHQGALQFRGTPCTTSQSLDVVPKHRQRMVDGEQRIPSRTFQLTLPRQ